MSRHRLTVAEQIAGLTSLEVAFNGMRRVHTMAAYRLREMRGEDLLQLSGMRALDYCEMEWQKAGCPTERWHLINFLEKMLRELKSRGGYPKVLLYRKKQIQRREFAIQQPGEAPPERCSCMGGWLFSGRPCPCPKVDPHREQLRKWGMPV